MAYGLKACSCHPLIRKTSQPIDTSAKLVSNQKEKTILFDSCVNAMGWWQGILKAESGLFLTPVLMLWGGSHIDRYVWRRAIVPLGLVQSFGTMCARYHYRMIHCAITYYVCEWFKSTRERQLMLNKITWQA